MTGVPPAGDVPPLAAPPIVPPVVGTHPLDDVRTILGICGLAPNIGRFITCHGITSMDDFEFIEHTETESVVKMHNDRYRTPIQKIGFPVQKKLKGFLYWYHDRLRRQEPIVAAEFTTARMKTAIRECAIDAAADDTEQVKITVGKSRLSSIGGHGRNDFNAALRIRREP